MDFLEVVFVFVIGLVIGFALALFEALIVLWIFHISNIAYLDTLDYWQVFGLCVAVGLMTSKAPSTSN
jgi:hypothetical protein